MRTTAYSLVASVQVLLLRSFESRRSSGASQRRWNEALQMYRRITTRIAVRGSPNVLEARDLALLRNEDPNLPLSGPYLTHYTGDPDVLTFTLVRRCARRHHGPHGLLRQ